MPPSRRRNPLSVQRLEDRATPATFTWDGGGADTNWSTAANWAGDVAPTAADTALVVVFPIADFSTLDIPGLSLDQLRFDGGADVDLNLAQNVTLDGSAPGPHVVDATGLNSITGAEFILSGTVVIQSTAATGQLDLDARLTGTGGLTKTGAGTVEIGGSVVNTYTGATLVADGTLALNNNVTNGAVSSNLTVGDGVGGAGTATLRLVQGSEIPDAATVVVAGDGRFVLGDNTTEAVNGLILGDSAGGGSVALGNGAVLSVLAGSVITNAAPTQSEITGNGTLVRTAATVFTVADGTAAVDLLLAVPIAADLAQGIVKNGDGLLAVTSTSAYTGPTTVNAGTLALSGSIAASPVTVNGGTLIGAGSAGPVTLLGGSLVPGNGTGAASALSTGAATLSGGRFAPRVSGTGTGLADSLNVAGAVVLNGAALAPTLSGAAPTAGQVFTVVSNDGADPVSGTFSGLAEGSVFASGGQRFRVSYVGGTGNDVTLTALGPTLVAPILVGGASTGTAILYDAATGQYVRSGDPRTFFPSGVTVRTAVADINGDGIDDLIGATGPGTPGRVVILDGANGATLADFLPFGSAFTDGLQISAGDLTGDAFAELAVSPDATGRPRVLIYNGTSLTGGTTAPNSQADFIGIADLGGVPESSFLGGARTAIGDVTGDGRNDLAVAAGFGGGPRLTIWNGTSFTTNPARVPTANPIANLFVFEARQRGGAWIALGELTGDNRADIICGGGPLGGPRVRVVDSAVLFALPNGTLQGVDLDVEVDQRGNAALVPYNYFGDDENARGGIRVQAADSNGDGQADFLLTGTGENLPSRVDVVSRASLLAVRGQNGRRPGTTQSFDPFGGTLADGVFVG